ncbi:acetyl-CoA carboxylase biotin carboxyl carrier protein subunit [Kitasatospora sp. NBC_01539]|uniref:acetyl-CoA carboxylase biotin carboxyl carrier protein subunit n=1 Tax=Kitasatospora sp. NBC_01539 TaxID=2903577 RepID=UPI0038602789
MSDAQDVEVPPTPVPEPVPSSTPEPVVAPAPAAPSGAGAGAVAVDIGRAAAVLEPGLDRPVSLVGARLSAAAAALLLAVGAGVTWSVFGVLPHTLALDAVVAHGTAPVTVRAAVPGAVVSLRVRPGAQVTAGEAVAVLRGADGRETDVRAAEAGTVTAVLTEPGSVLAPGAPVVALDATGRPATVRLFATSAAEARELVPGRTVSVPVPGVGTVRAVITAVDLLPVRADSLDGTLAVPLPGLPVGAAPVWTAYADLPAVAGRPGPVLPGPLPVSAAVDLGARHPYQAVLGKGAAR